jgi:NAD(P)-dependent dehydrogenase (short-subunit alcohol dehydrogenase family)
MERNPAVARDLDRLFNLDGKVAVVVGAASGIGKATAGLLAEAGADVIVADHDKAGADTVVSSLVGQGGQASSAGVDVTQEESVQDLFASRDTVDIVINCVGIYPKTALLETTTDEWDRVHAVNLKGAFVCIREAGKSMVAGGRGGSIVSVSSISSLHPSVIGNAAYGASKGGLNVLTKTAALELGPHDIRVNAVLPGGTLTEGALRPSPAPRKGPILGEGRVLMGRMAQPLEIAAGILFLASPASSYMTGQTLVLDGGFLVT